MQSADLQSFLSRHRFHRRNSATGLLLLTLVSAFALSACAVGYQDEGEPEPRQPRKLTPDERDRALRRGRYIHGAFYEFCIHEAESTEAERSTTRQLKAIFLVNRLHPTWSECEEAESDLFAAEEI